MLKGPSFWWCLLIIATCLPSSIHSNDTEEVSFPLRCRTEGRITLIYPRGESKLNHHLVFSESIDQLEVRSTISIGYPSYPPTKYYTNEGTNTVTLDANGVCKASDKYIGFVPELSWFVDFMLPGVDVQKLMEGARHIVGPTGLARLFVRLAGSKFVRTGKEVHRNIKCNVHTKTLRPQNSTKMNLQINVLIAENGLVFSSMKNPIFCVKVKVTYDDPIMSDGDLVKETSFVLDYFNIESMDDDKGVINRMRNDFNLPLGKGCSQNTLERKPIQPDLKARSFSLVYQQSSKSEYQMLAYDHDSKLLRKAGDSVSIWDLNDSILYNINTNASAFLEEQGLEHSSKSCSVLKVLDSKLSPAYRPCEEIGGSIEIVKLLGIEKLSFMGRGMVRDMPCLIYETILSDPPVLFGFTNDQLEKWNTPTEKDYIVQYHLLEGEQKITDTAPLKLDASQFWPAQIVLYRRFTKENKIEQVDQLDIYDFHWSLDGWNMKSNQLFMASECFNDEKERLRLEMKLMFEKTSEGEQENRLLASNKYKLEYDLVDDLSKLTGFSRLDIVDYHLKLRPAHVNLEMVLADRSENLELLFYGEGNLANPGAYEKNLVKLEGLSEENCLLTSSHIDDISLVIYCPYSDLGKSTCSAVFGESEPAIRNDQSNLEDLGRHQRCHAYRFKPTPVLRKGASNMLERSNKLYDYRLSFWAKVPGGDSQKVLFGSVKDFYLSHDVELLTISNYMYSVESNENSTNPDLKHIDSIKYENREDCERICNLDATCRSFSYCLDENVAHKCVLSTLNIREFKVQDQLVHSSFSESQKVKGDKKREFQLKLADRCDIRERNYLTMFRQTDEVIRLKQEVIGQFRRAPSTFDCAKISADLERRSNKHHVAMFAYCPSMNANVCLMDENLFAPTSNKDNDASSGGNTSQELLCRVYRKKYQTYFKISGLVVKKPEEKSDEVRQIELEFNNVEQCAQACWIKFGQVCHSFDFCSATGSCYINHIGEQLRVDDIDNDQVGIDSKLLESRPGCLHYKRDLKLDDLRGRHEIGRHDLLVRPAGTSSGFGGFLLNLLTCLLVVGSFIYGLVLGRQLNDKMEAVTILRQSISLGSGLRASQLFHNFPGRSAPGSGSDLDDRGVNALISRSRGSIGRNINSDNAIKMDVIQRHDGDGGVNGSGSGANNASDDDDNNPFA